MTEPRRLLVVCTANLCRSPVAEAMLARRLTGLVDVDGRSWTVASAGTDRYDGLVVEPDTATAAATRGLDLSNHIPRQLMPAHVTEADLVLTMTRSHLRSIVANDPTAWPKTFTIRELGRRATRTLGVSDGFEGWLSEVAEGRRAADLVNSSIEDDVSDPYRQGLSANGAMVGELESLVDELIRSGPWLVAPRG